MLLSIRYLAVQTCRELIQNSWVISVGNLGLAYRLMNIRSHKDSLLLWSTAISEASAHMKMTRQKKHRCCCVALSLLIGRRSVRVWQCATKLDWCAFADRSVHKVARSERWHACEREHVCVSKMSINSIIWFGHGGRVWVCVACILRTLAHDVA